MEEMVDILDREEFVDIVFDVMLRSSKRKSSLRFAINGEWGVGKSFILDMLAERLNVYQCEETYGNQFMVFRYNSWEYDYYDEPIIAIVAALQDSLVEQNIDCKLEKAKERIVKIAAEGLKCIANQLSTNTFGVNIEDLLKSLEPLGPINDELSGVKKTIKIIRNCLMNISQYMTIVIMIDELDRCLPEYVIKILNRCSHLFSGIDNIQLIYAINAEQLGHSIKTIFGSNINIDSYLHKFYDSTFELGNGTVDEGLLKKYEKYFGLFDLDAESGVKKEITQIMNVLDLDARTVDVIIRKIQLTHDMIETREKNPVLLLFELVVAFFTEAKLIDFSWNSFQLVDDGELTALCPDGTVSDEVHEIIVGWSRKGINQEWRMPVRVRFGELLRGNTYGKLIYCLNALFGKETDNISKIESFDLLEKECRDFWNMYQTIM